MAKEVHAHPDGHDMPSVTHTLTPGATAGTPRAILRSAPDDLTDLPLQVLAGALPDDLRGHVFISGPRVHRGTPALSCNGVVCRIDLRGAEGATFSSAAVRTAGYYVRRAVDHLGYLRRPFVDHRIHEFRPVGLGMFSVTLGAQELPNTAPVLIPRSGRMLVTTDAGRPWQIDPATLRAISPLGYRREWRSSLPLPWMHPLLQTTAHATIDPHTEDLYISNHAPVAPLCTPFTHVCRWSERDPRVRHWNLVDEATGAEVTVQTLHQLVITRNHIVLLDSDFPVDIAEAMAALLKPWAPIPPGLVERLTAPETSAVASVWVVKKSDLVDVPETLSIDNPPTVKARRFVIGPGGLHFAVDYEDTLADGRQRIRLVASHTPTEDLTHVLRAGEPLALGGTVPDYLDGMLTPVPILRGEIGVHDLDLDSGMVNSRVHACDQFTWGVAVYSHAGVLPGELELLRARPGPEGRALRYLWFNAGGFTPDLLPKALYDLYANRGEPLEALPRKLLPASLFRFDTDTGAFDGFSFPVGWYGFAPTFVPSAKPDVAPEDGYVIITMVSDPTDRLPEGSNGDEIWIFEAMNIARGPICRLGSPRLQFGMTLHSMWIAKLRPPPETNLVDLRRDLLIEEIRQRYLDFFGAELPAPWKQLLGPVRALMRYAMDFKDLERLLNLEVFPYFDR